MLTPNLCGEREMKAACLCVITACILFQVGCDDSFMFRVALLQMMPSKDMNTTYNIQKAIQFCKEAAANGADVALFPEMWNIGTFFRCYTAYNMWILIWLFFSIAVGSQWKDRLLNTN